MGADVPSGASLTLYARTGDTLTDDGFGISTLLTGRMCFRHQRLSDVEAANRPVGTSSSLVLRLSRPSIPAWRVGSAGPYRSATPASAGVLSWDGEEKLCGYCATLLKCRTADASA